MKKTERYIHDRLPADFYSRIEKGIFNRNFYPGYSNRKAWKKCLDNPLVGKIISGADLIPENQVPQLLYSNYRQFNVNGNRTEYEALYFRRRMNLAYLAAALCLTGDKEKYLARVLDYTIAILEEGTWCVPAHASWEKDTIDRWRFCDLFAAETGAIMALLSSILGEELEKEIPGIMKTIAEKTLSRTVYAVFDKELFHWWDRHETPANWTPWCSGNCLVTALLMEQNPKKRLAQVKHFLANVSRFISHYSDDGYCPEGPSYYMKANLMVFQTLLILEKAIPGSMKNLFSDPKLKAMMEFLPNVRIGGNNLVTFGDAQPGLRSNPAFILPAGKYFNSEPLLEIACLKEFNIGISGDYLASFLAHLFDRPADLPDNMTAGMSQSVFKNRLAVFRSEKFSVSLKSGNNSEPHNHNDQGHFELFSGDVPVILDAGTGFYAKINFSEQRYTLWNTRGNGHNAPVFGKYEQVYGKDYVSTFTVHNQTLCCDLSKAYPAEAGVKTAERKIEFSDSKVTVEDSFSLKKKLPAVITLLTVCKPVVRDSHTILLGNVTLSLENIEFSEMEIMPELVHDRNGKMKNIWDSTITAIRLKSGKNCYKMVFFR